jgi:methylglutaconyl-CoA hydratase
MPEPITSKFVDVQDEAVDRGVQLQATREGLAVVLLNRPERGNALGTREIAALTEAFVTLQGAEGVRLVVLRGAGGNFSIGGDPAWMRETLERTTACSPSTSAGCWRRCGPCRPSPWRWSRARPWAQARA